MKFLYFTSVCILTAIFLVLPGCSTNDDSGADKGGAGNGAAAKGGQGSDTDSVVDAAKLVIGKWTVDKDLTKKGWGDRSAEMEKKLFDQLGMTIEFKDGNRCLIINNDGNGETYDVYWEITGKSEGVVEVVVAESKDADKKIQVKISFENSDRFLYQSSEAEFTDDLIFQRAIN